MMARTRNARRCPGRGGATVLEMALVAPAVLLLLFGMIDLGIAVYAYNTLAEAVRAGTRYAAVHGGRATTPVGPVADDKQIERVVRSYAPGFVASRLRVSSSWPDGDNDPNSHITVSASYDYTPAVTALLGFKTLKLGSTSTMSIVH
jgi:Flp pilus assembly protein TadG